MKMLSEDDLNLKGSGDDELARGISGFNLARSTNASDPPFTHVVFAAMNIRSLSPPNPFARDDLRLD